MKQTERIEFLRNSSKFIQLSNPHFEPIPQFKILSVHFVGENIVLVIKHNNKVICVARHPKDFKTQSYLSNLELLSIEQLAGQALPKINIIIEYEANHQARTW